MTTPGPHYLDEVLGWLTPRVPRGALGPVLFGDRPPKSWRHRLYVCNIDKSSGPGTHWTGFYLAAAPSNVCLYFDPMGYPPPKALHSSLTKCGRHTVYSTTRNQREGANCGARTAIALRDLAACPTTSDAIQHFKTILAAD